MQSEIMTQPTFSCYECDKDGCEVPDIQMSICNTTINCWKSLLREYKNNTLYSRGCVATLEDNQRICSNVTQANDTESVYSCCAEEFCNTENLPVMEPLFDEVIAATGNIWVFYAFTTIVLILWLCIIAGLIRICILSHRHRNIRRQRRAVEVIAMGDMPLMNGRAHVIP